MSNMKPSSQIRKWYEKIGEKGGKAKNPRKSEASRRNMEKARKILAEMRAAKYQE